MRKTIIISVLISGFFLAIASGALLSNSPTCNQPHSASVATNNPATILSNADQTIHKVSLPVEEPVADSNATPSPTREINVVLRQGETLAKSLSRNNVPKDIRQLVINQLADYLDFRRLMPGHQYSIALDEKNQLLWCLFQAGPLNSYRLQRTDQGYEVYFVEVPLECRTVTLSGTIRSSLFASFLEMDEKPRLVYSFADIFGSKIDFNTETRKGDQFALTVEKYFKGEEFVGYGGILHAVYKSDSTDKLFEGFYYASEETPGAFFDRNGEELGTWFIRSPVPVGRVTSGFNRRRMHPILKYKRPHLGVDLAAPHGTPILAVADGRVVFKGRNGGYGNNIVLNHGNGYRTHYGHLSRFKKGLKIGRSVKKKEIIGYIGSTGLSTGPHVCYRFEKDGKFLNPFAMKFNPQSILNGSEMARFKSSVAILKPLYEPSRRPKVVQVRQVTFSPENPIAFL